MPKLIATNWELCSKERRKKNTKYWVKDKSQSLKILCQFKIRRILIITWKRRAIVLSNKKYEIIEHKEMQKLVFWINLFFITDIDKHVRPKDRKE